MTTFIQNINVYKLFFVLVSVIILLPQFGSIDNMSTRWLGLTICNLLFFSHFYFFKINHFFVYNRLLLTLLVLFILSLISILYSTNSSESILFSSKLFIVLSTLYNLSLCSYNFKNILKYFITVIVLTLALEVGYIIFYSSIFGFSQVKGISMNANISSFSILLKVPVLLYAQQVLRKFKNYLVILEILIFLCLLILGSRASLLIILIIYFLSCFIKSDTKPYSLNDFKRAGIAFIFFLSSLLNIGIQNPISGLALSSDQSILLRLEYYKVALKSISENPWFGLGAGSWKLDSLTDFTQTMDATIVPYYTHNDFLQLFYELGILGFILYLLFFISFYFNSIKSTNLTFRKFFLLSLLVFLFDSLINFPIHRPQEIITFLLVSYPVLTSKKLKNKLRINLLSFSLIILFFCSIIIQFKEHKSLILQNILMSDVSLQKYSLSINELNDIDSSLPSLSSNTVPLDTYISRYYFEENDNKNALKFSYSGYNLNPHLKYTKEQYLKALLLNNEFNKALEISRKLFYQDSNNEVYAETYLDLLFINSKLIEVEELFFNLLKSSQENLIVKLLNYYSNLTVKNLDFLSEALFQSASQFPNNSSIKSLSKNYLK